MKQYTTTTRPAIARDERGRFTSESAWVAAKNAERSVREERAERNRQAETQYGLTPGDLIFA
jgi:hypothetical protein